MIKTVYYAHFMGIYDTPQEARDIKTLEDIGLQVLNPNNKAISKEFEDMDGPYEGRFSKVFLDRVRQCEVFAFKALPDGRIPGGVAMELSVAQSHNKLIIELPSGTHARKMGRDDTREYLHDIGQR
jgi:hypothetical protein